jgi:hypothetical protein
MQTLDRKVWRDLMHRRGQMFAIILVLACGIAVFVTMISNLQSLERSMARYYESNRFADVFARVVHQVPGAGNAAGQVEWYRCQRLSGVESDNCQRLGIARRECMGCESTHQNWFAT